MQRRHVLENAWHGGPAVTTPARSWPLLAALALLAGCGGKTMPSRTHVEQEVARQAKATLAPGNPNVATQAHCVEHGGRSWLCAIRTQVGPTSLSGGNVTAVVSKDGKRIVVSGL